MAKISELVADREKLEKYDELMEWKDFFKEQAMVKPSRNGLFSVPLPGYIKEIIVAALDAEIKKLDEE